MNKITVHQRPNTRGQATQAAGFTKKFVIHPGDTETLAQAVEFDNCPAQYLDGYRLGKNFQIANCVLADIDNNQTDNPNDWITPERVAAELPGVVFYYYPSRNHMREKEGKAPRPKFHLIFPIREAKDANEYTGIMRWLIGAFPVLHFDKGVKGPAQLNFGVENAQVTYVSGEMNLSELMEKRQPAAVKTMKATTDGIIPEGQRYSTLISYAATVLIRWGDTDGQAYRAFLEKAAKCSPPLESNEVDRIWKSALSLYKNTIQPKPEYIPPEYFRPQSKWPLPVVDQKAITALYKSDPVSRRFRIPDARLLLKAFGLTIRMNEMNKRVEIKGLPKEYSGEDEHNLLITLIADAASKLAYDRRATNAVAHESLAVLASENRYHPVVELLEAEQWDGIDRLTEVYRIMGLTDGFYKTLVRKWALQTIAVLYNTDKEKPIAAQGVLVLQGPQGVGKTQLFTHLAIKDQFFKGGATLDMTNKDSVMSATKVWICELGEIDSTTKKEQSALKAFLTEQTDRYREPYARCEVVRPRRTSFCGTVNPKGYLRDETGNRRYWTIPVDNMDVEQIFKHPPEWYTQFWRQMLVGYSQNPKGRLLTRDEEDKVNERNSEYEVELYGEDEFVTTFNTEANMSEWGWKTAAEIAQTLNEKYNGLKISSESIGRRLIPRIEKRTGKTIERKAVRGRRLIQCPPITTGEIPYASPRKVVGDYTVPEATTEGVNF